MIKNYILKIQGIVQGVGFRPFVYLLAKEYGLNGYVLNNSQGVEVGIRCSFELAADFAEKIKKLAPPLSHIVSIKIEAGEDELFDSFNIVSSEHVEGLSLVLPDICICNDCKNELIDNKDRRHEYPFINCTNCGPRYSIIKSIPYDRKLTTMSEFEMCPACLAEYENPENRRFHAQPNCCPDCGPNVFSSKNYGKKALAEIVSSIDEGQIVAVKGLGGYHLMCDALNEQAVAKLRFLKQRGEKPFAVMCKDVSILEKYVTLNDIEKNMISSPQSPVLLIDWQSHPFSQLINPLGNNIGVMVAYTPLHFLLMSKLKTDFIVATSGNLRDEPICIDEVEAENSLKKFTNIFLHHNRKIHNRVDDSVVTATGGFPYVLRRARGFAPYPVMLPVGLEKTVAGAGAYLKSTICFAGENFAFPSQYIGDLDNPETRDFYSETWQKMEKLLDITPEVVITDLHPDFYSTRFGLEKAENHMSVQHHLSHFYAVLGENGHKGDALGLILDGTGLGADGKIWGGEFFIRKDKAVRRAVHLPYIFQPAMDTAAKKPAMMLMSLMKSYGLEKYSDFVYKRFPEHSQMLKLTEKILETRLNSIETSSAGRLFEAAGAITFGAVENDFEAHLAIKFEYTADKLVTDYYETDLMNPAGLFEGLFKDLILNVSPALCSARFHNGFAKMLVDVCKTYCEGINSVALSGGVFQNMLLLNRVLALLKSNNFKPLLHEKVPANDSCISLGQVCSYVYGDKILF